MTTSSRAGLGLVKTSEGCKLTAYLCPANVWTIGYGRTTNVKRGDTCTQAQADAWLVAEYDQFEAGVLKLVGKREHTGLSDNALGALVSFAYNVGLANLASSTLLKRVKAGDMAGAAAQFASWNKARVNGALKPLAGLTTRRANEAALFLK
jgi:lysozyme